MVFKLVRCDAVEPCKIQLPIGKHLIGRGQFLGCEDKRVSRHHGELEVSDDLVVIRALHQNPCFYLKKGTSETQILKHNCSTNLTNGDRFGLLPDVHWYEVLLCNLSDLSQSPEVHNEKIGKVVDFEQNGYEATSDKTIFSSDRNKDEIQKEFSEDLNARSPETSKTNLGDDAANEQDSPSLLPLENQTSTQEYQLTDQQSPSKRNREQDDDTENGEEIKRIKVEPNIKQEQEDVKAGPSNNPGVGVSDDNAKVAPPSPAKPANNGPLRERCIYGANCYRRNPQHKVQFSHPTDNDWGAGERGVCPWGAACARRDPRHWRDHEHPPGMRPPTQHRQGKEKKKRKARELSPESDLIVTGKRPRKLTKRPSWSGSESENEYDMDDPFLTDGSDEWEPPSDISESQDLSQDTLDY